MDWGILLEAKLRIVLRLLLLLLPARRVVVVLALSVVHWVPAL